MHDDRIAGVTFEENASRNALIVNKEYAWVGNPFSAPKQQGGPQWFSLLLWVLSCGFVPGDLKTPLSGAGGVNKQSRNRSRKTRVQAPFSAPRGRESRKVLPPSCILPQSGIRHPRPQNTPFIRNGRLSGLPLPQQPESGDMTPTPISTYTTIGSPPETSQHIRLLRNA